MLQSRQQIPDSNLSSAGATTPLLSIQSPLPSFPFRNSGSANASNFAVPFSFAPRSGNLSMMPATTSDAWAGLDSACAITPNRPWHGPSPQITPFLGPPSPWGPHGHPASLPMPQQQPQLQPMVANVSGQNSRLTHLVGTIQLARS